MGTVSVRCSFVRTSSRVDAEQAPVAQEEGKGRPVGSARIGVTMIESPVVSEKGRRKISGAVKWVCAGPAV